MIEHAAREALFLTLRARLSGIILHSPARSTTSRGIGHFSPTLLMHSENPAGTTRTYSHRPSPSRLTCSVRSWPAPRTMTAQLDRDSRFWTIASSRHSIPGPSSRRAWKHSLSSAGRSLTVGLDISSLRTARWMRPPSTYSSASRSRSRRPLAAAYGPAGERQANGQRYQYLTSCRTRVTRR
jgi:hypothetical protein